MNRVYSCPAFTIPGVKLHINHLEMLNIVVALRLWGHWWANASVSIRCDNLAVVQVVNSHKNKDAILGVCVHNIWLICALHNISLSIVHIKGNLNVKADLLSRLYSDMPVACFIIYLVIPFIVNSSTHHLHLLIGAYLTFILYILSQ